ncbi:MAG TPA: tRNA (adenosine(37)-N6)-threonylcarbamoyltransferase complex transferase subunit TsaD, partial [Candidatus Latescibacteria bacterium]|nr:tRNA (adenosine(37)-N6)-threonylcarbamoyltransferase complex transferase subunit TsaD [Candidatus Latescibacterota bacterium]
MRVLGIETSCDETAVAVWEDNVGLRSNIVASQVEHSAFGGVVPELASRAHIRKIIPVIRHSLSEAGLSIKEVDGIAVTYGPGLIGSLVVGLSVAKALALALKVPLIGVHHIEAHLFSSLIEAPDLPLPLMALVASGGHTELVLVRDWGNYRVLGSTRDDADGEAFDKVAKMLSLGYPGGPEIDRLARMGNPEAVHFPRPLPEGWDFSFSGLKTAVLYHLEGR